MIAFEKGQARICKRGEEGARESDDLSSARDSRQAGRLPKVGVMNKE